MIFVAFALLLFVFCLIAKFTDEFNNLHDFSVVGGILTVIVMILCLVTLPFQRMDVHSRIAQFHAIEASRLGGTPIEAAAWRMQVAEQNAWLASAKYYNHTQLFDLWYPDEVDQVEPIK